MLENLHRISSWSQCLRVLISVFWQVGGQSLLSEHKGTVGEIAALTRLKRKLWVQMQLELSAAACVTYKYKTHTNANIRQEIKGDKMLLSNETVCLLYQPVSSFWLSWRHDRSMDQSRLAASDVKLCVMGPHSKIIRRCLSSLISISKAILNLQSTICFYSSHLL